jgi:hypothetical protein
MLLVVWAGEEGAARVVSEIGAVAVRNFKDDAYLRELVKSLWIRIILKENGNPINASIGSISRIEQREKIVSFVFLECFVVEE